MPFFSCLKDPSSTSSSEIRDGGRPLSGPAEGASPMHILSNAQNTTLNNPVFNEYRAGNAEELAIQKLESHTDPNAAVDSSARHPPPSCHPKTRLAIRQTLTKTFGDPGREYLMAWLFGAAGTGKSAVGQTFSEESQDRGKLGAAFFFSRPNGRNRYETVIPSLAHQLMDHCPPYRSALLPRLMKKHQIFNKAPHVQFRELIVEPLLEARSKITTTYLMLLDGVDECGAHPNNAYKREKEQCQLIEMIAGSIQAHPDLPLFWLLCSRPEQHLQKTFAGITTKCRREELAIDAKCREEVEEVLRDGFARIATKRDIIPSGSDTWPSREEFQIVERAVSGLHVFGAAILKDIEHSEAPVEQLKSLIPFLEHVGAAGSTRSIGDMDELYIRILNEIPDDRLPTTIRIIGALITMREPEKLPAQAFCNFLRLDPNDFSSALRKVHSVVNIPPTEIAHIRALHLYHASFSDFLTDDRRSGKFFIDKEEALVDIIKLCLFWHQLHSNLFHSSDQPLLYDYEVTHDHDPLPRANLPWVTSPGNHLAISEKICKYSEQNCFRLFGRLSNQRHDELLSIVLKTDFRHMTVCHGAEKIDFFNWVYKQEPLSGFIRTQLNNEIDRKLLNYLEEVTKKPISPARFPLTWCTGRKVAFREYLLIGRDSLSIIVWITKSSGGWGIMALNLDQAYNIIQWALEMQTHGWIFWDVYVMLAMPVLWLTWSILAFIVCIVWFMWRARTKIGDAEFPVTESTELGFRIFICVALGVAVIYGVLILNTFRRYGSNMNEEWRKRAKELFEGDPSKTDGGMGSKLITQSQYNASITTPNVMPPSPGPKISTGDLDIEMPLMNYSRPGSSHSRAHDPSPSTTPMIMGRQLSQQPGYANTSIPRAQISAVPVRSDTGRSDDTISVRGATPPPIELTPPERPSLFSPSRDHSRSSSIRSKSRNGSPTF